MICMLLINVGMDMSISLVLLNPAIFPSSKIIQHIRSLPPSLVIADFGCGEARIAQRYVLRGVEERKKYICQDIECAETQDAVLSSDRGLEE